MSKFLHLTGVGGVSHFNNIVQICLRLTLIAMVTKISQFEHKVSYNPVFMRKKSDILHPTADI